MTDGKLVKYAAGCVLAAFLVLAGGAVLRYLIPALLPAVLGYGLAAWVRKLGRCLRRFTGSHTLPPAGERIGGIAGAIVLCILVLWGGGKGLSALAGQAAELVSRAAHLWDWSSLPQWVRERVPEAWQTQIGGAVTALVEKGAGWLAGAAGGIVTALPGAAMAVVITVVSLFYWLLDREGILAACRRLVPESWRKRIRTHTLWQTCTERVAGITHAAGAYLRAQLSMAMVQFFVLTVGLSLLQIHSAAAWGCLIALVDILPLLGAGVILVPWSVFGFLTHRIGLGVGMAVLWLALFLLRQWLEPRLVGKALGVHPFIMLTALYGACRIAGVGGMILCAVGLGALGTQTEP